MSAPTVGDILDIAKALGMIFAPGALVGGGIGAYRSMRNDDDARGVLADCYDIGDGQTNQALRNAGMGAIGGGIGAVGGSSTGVLVGINLADNSSDSFSKRSKYINRGGILGGLALGLPMAYYATNKYSNSRAKELQDFSNKYQQRLASKLDQSE